MRLGVERDCSRAGFRFQRLNDREFLRRFLFRNRGRAIAARRKRKPRCIIERTPIDSRADRDGGDDFSGFGVEHRHHFVMTSGKQTMMHRVQCNAARLRSRRNWPASDDLVFGGVDHRDFTFVFDVAVDAPRNLIRHRELWTTSERNRCNDLRLFRVDHRGRISGVIENVNFAAARFVDDCVRICAGVDL